MTVEKEREEFEKWYFKKYQGTTLKGSPKRWEETGEYIADRAEQTWQAWQAGRAAMQSQDREDDPLQPAANWLIQAIDKCTITDIQDRLSIGYNRAQCLFDHARRNEGEA